jgi:hypothetical protein
MKMSGRGYTGEQPAREFQQVEPGLYRVIVTYVDESLANPNFPGKLQIEFCVISGTVEGQEDRKISLFIKVDETNKNIMARLTHLAVQLGLLKPNEDADICFADAMGRQLVIEVETNEYIDKSGTKKSNSQIAWWGFWAPGRPEVSHVPRNAVLDKLAGRTAAPAPAAPAAPAAPVAPPAAPANLPTPSDSDRWNNV